VWQSPPQWLFHLFFGAIANDRQGDAHMTNDHERKLLTRRDLLKLTGVGASGLLVQPASVLASSTDDEVDADNAAAMLYDATRCVGCRSCEVACKEWNDLPPEPDSEPLTDTTAYTWTLIKQYQEGSVESFRKYQCMHCLHPGCVSVCLVGALVKLENGPVVYDSYKCIGCRYCMMACPFGVPKYEWDKPLPLVSKCTFCADRLEDGLIPACAEACPVEALTFGTRKEMIQEARDRIDQNPDRYIDHIYGEEEVGGTSVLFLSAVPFEDLGFATDLGSRPITNWSESAMEFVPIVVPSLLIGLGGIAWLRKRQVEPEGESTSATKEEEI
jgi:formate dehydrogenase beta subunit